MPNRYIYKVAPETFRLYECLREVDRHKGEIALVSTVNAASPGDIVYLWEDAPHRGLCGVSTIIQGSYPRQQPEWQREYNSSPYDPYASRLLLRVNRIAHVRGIGRDLLHTFWGTLQRCDAKLAAQFDQLSAKFFSVPQPLSSPPKR